ncbi:MAG: PLP-dependent aminotransferase family protein [Clostridium sp.]|nr:PLP-dependent aminotransferase family protein [Clostridium sp.]
MKECFNIEFQDEIPKYIQISQHIKKLIENNLIEDGEKLPTIRDYTKFLKVNKVTIVNAYKKLTHDGFSYQKIGSGTYAKKKEIVSLFRKEYSKTLKLLSTSKNLEEAIDFTGETTGECLFPIEDFKRIINFVLERDGAKALVSNDSLGYEKLRGTINEVFWNNTIKEENMLIVSGAQQGIDIVAKSILNINDSVIVEKPTYGGALSVFKWRRANIFEVEVEKDGVNLEKFEEILKKNKIRCFYTMSYFQNPTGISYSLEKKKKLLELAEKYNFYIIEDDYLSELIYDKTVEYIPFKWLDNNDRVIYIKSFSKIFLPGIRIGYIIMPSKFKESMQFSKVSTDITTSSLMQRALEMYIKDGTWKKSIESLSREYEKRYKIMESAIEGELGHLVNFYNPGGGLNFYLEIRDKRVSSKMLFLNLVKKGVYITPAVLFFSKMKDGNSSFRLNFSQTNEEKIKKGIQIIREEIQDVIYNS